MKTSKLYILLLSTLAFASCTKEMTEGLDEVNVSVVTSETVTAEGSIITVKKGNSGRVLFCGRT
mgnify:CR=1 FL=1